MRPWARATDNSRTRLPICEENEARYLEIRNEEDSRNGSDYESQRRLQLLTRKELGKLKTPSITVQPIMYPKAQILSKSRQWRTQRRDDASAGLSTRCRSNLLENVHPNIISRLHERNARENLSKPLRLHTESYQYPHGGSSPLSAAVPIVWCSHEENCHEVLLEIGFNELVFDDHACISLEDRLAAELMECYHSYASLLSRQPWTLRLSRIQAVLHHQIVKPASDLQGVTYAFYEAVDALNDIKKLQQLYNYILEKCVELSKIEGPKRHKVSAYWLAEREDSIPLHDTMTSLLEYIQSLPPLIEGKDADNILRGMIHSIDSPSLNHIIILPWVSHLDQEYPEGNELSSDEQMSFLIGTTSRQETHYRIALCGSEKAQYQCFIVLYSDNKLIAWTKANRVKSSKVDICHIFRVQMPTFPNLVTMFLYQSTSRFLGFLLRNRANIHVAMAMSTLLTPNGIPLIIPGHLSPIGESVNDSAWKRIKPTDEWYQFSCSKEIPRALWHSSFLDFSQYDEIKRHTSGRVHVKTRWMMEENSVLIEPNMLPPHENMTNWYKPLVGHRIGSRHFLKDQQSRPEALESDRVSFRTRSLRHAAIRPNSRMEHAHEPFVLTKRNQLLRMRSQMLMHHYGTSAYPMNERDLWQLNGDIPLLPIRMTPQDILKRLKDPIPLFDAEIVCKEKYLPLLRPDWKALTYKVLQQQAEEADLPLVERLSQQKAWKVQQFLESVIESGKGASQPEIVRERVHSLQSIVRETPLPQFPTSLLDWESLFRSLFSRRRRLNPQKRRRSEPFVFHQPANQCSLHIQVREGINLPIRISSFTSLTSKKRSKRAPFHRRSDPDGKTNSHLIQLECESNYYVEVAFQGRRIRTSCASVSETIDVDTDFRNTAEFARASSHPVWLEMLTFSLQPPHNDFSPESISQLTDTIHVNVFDQVTTSVAVPIRKFSDKQPTSELFIRESRLVGTLEIPFSAVYQRNGLVDVTIRLDTPRLHLGYLNLTSLSQAQRSSTESDVSETESFFTKRIRQSESQVTRDDEIESMNDSSTAPFLSLTLEVDPLLPSHRQSTRRQVLTSLHNWTDSWRKSVEGSSGSTKYRSFDPFAFTASGKTTLMTQFLLPMTPPQLLIQSIGSTQTSVLQRILWYVRMIPSLAEYSSYQRGSWDDIWLSSHEFLDLQAGNMQDHAVLLCNFLSWYDLEYSGHSYRNYLALGNGISKGKAVFVLRRRISPHPRVWLIDANQAAIISDEDDLNPPIDIAMLVSSRNVYANLQPLDASCLKNWSWDIENDDLSWKALFPSSTSRSDSLPTGLPPPIQCPTLQFSPILDDEKQLETQLCDILHMEIRKWRNERFSTVMNAKRSAELYTFLVDAEKSCRNTVSDATISMQWVYNLRSIQKLQVSGTMQHFAFAELQSIIKAVKSTV